MHVEAFLQFYDAPEEIKNIVFRSPSGDYSKVHHSKHFRFRNTSSPAVGLKIEHLVKIDKSYADQYTKLREGFLARGPRARGTHMFFLDGYVTMSLERRFTVTYLPRYFVNVGYSLNMFGSTQFGFEPHRTLHRTVLLTGTTN
jgi:hypothetical protein